MFLQRHDGRHYVKRLQPRLELVHLELDDGLGAIGFGSPVGDMRGHHLLQVVDVVHEDTVELVHLRIDIAWHRNVDEEHRAVAAAAQELLAVLLVKDGVRRASRGDDDVGAIDCIVKLVESNRFAVKLLGQYGGAIVGAVADEDFVCAMSQQVARGEFAHLACSDEVNALAFEIAEDLFGQFYGDRGNGNCRSSNRGFSPYSLGNGKGARIQRIELGVDRADSARGGIGFFHLAQNLRLAYHHRVQARSDAKDMANGVALAILVEILAKGPGIEAIQLLKAAVNVSIGVLG